MFSSFRRLGILGSLFNTVSIEIVFNWFVCLKFVDLLGLDLVGLQACYGKRQVTTAKLPAKQVKNESLQKF